MNEETKPDMSESAPYEAAEHLLESAQGLVAQAKADGDQLVLMVVCLKGTDHGDTTSIEGASGRTYEGVPGGGPMDLQAAKALVRLVQPQDLMKAQFLASMEAGDMDHDCEDPDCPVHGDAN